MQPHNASHAPRWGADKHGSAVCCSVLQFVAKYCKVLQSAEVLTLGMPFKYLHSESATNNVQVQPS